MENLNVTRNRDAAPVIRGFVYQVDLSILSWLDLQENEFLELERGEDIDLVQQALSSDEMESARLLIQVKNLTRKLTMRAEESVGALASFYEHLVNNPLKKLRFRFLTNTAVGRENENPFAPAIPVIVAWEALRKNECSEGGIPTYLAGIRRFLSGLSKPSKLNGKTWKQFQAFVKESDASELLEFIRRVEWVTLAPGIDELAPIILDRLVRDFGVHETSVQAAYERLFAAVFRLLTKSDVVKQLTASQLRDALSSLEMSQDARELFVKMAAIMTAAQLAIETRLEKFEAGVMTRFEEQAALIQGIPERTAHLVAVNLEDKGNRVGFHTLLESQLEYGKTLIKENKPSEALTFLVDLRNQLTVESPKEIRFRLTTLIGSAHLALDHIQDGAIELVNAFKISPEETRAKTNAAHAYLLLGEKEQAQKCISEALAVEPYNADAFAALIQLRPRNEIEDVIKQIPEAVVKKPDVAYAIGHVYKLNDDPHNAIYWLRLARESSTQQSIELDVALGTLILETASENIDSSMNWPLNEDSRCAIVEAKELIASAWNLLSDPQLKRAKVWWLANIATAEKLLGNSDRAMHHINEALSLDPSDLSLVKNAAILYFESRELEKAIDLLRSHQETGHVEIILLLAEFERLSKNYDKAIRLLNLPLEFQALLKSRNRLLAIAHAEKGDFPIAISLLESELAENPKNLQLKLDLADVCVRQGDKDRALSHYNEVFDEDAWGGQLKVSLDLANGFYELGEFEKASKVFFSLNKVPTGDWLDKRTAAALYYSGQQSELLAFCRSVREKIGPTDDICEMEVITLEESGSYEEALEICSEFLVRFPKQQRMQLRRAVLLARLGRTHDVEDYLSTPKDYATIDFESGLNIANLFLNSGELSKTLDTLYEVMRAHYSNGEAHLKYVGFFLSSIRDESIIRTVDEVEPGSFVRIQTRSGVLQYIIESRPDADIRLNEINLEHPLAKLLLGKKVGDTVRLRDNLLSPEEGKVLSIESKYVYALNRSRELLETQFPDVEGFWSIPIEDPKDLEPIKKVLERQNQQAVVVEQLYRRGQITLGMLANRLGRSVIKTWAMAASKPMVGILAADGHQRALAEAFSLLSNVRGLVIDISSILTISEIGFRNDLTRIFGRPAVAQSTLGLLEQEIQEFSGFRKEGFLTIGHDGTALYKQEVSAEEVKDHIRQLTELRDWIKEHCDVLPSVQTFPCSRSERRTIEEALGESFYDSMLIAKANNLLLLSEDLLLRLYAKQTLEIDGVWSQALLMFADRSGAVSKQLYCRASIRLKALNHNFMRTDADIVIEAAQMSGWKPKEPMTSILATLGGSYSDIDSACIVTAQALFNAWQAQISSETKMKFLIDIMHALFQERDKDEVWPVLVDSLTSSFSQDLARARQFFDALNILYRYGVVRRYYVDDARFRFPDPYATIRYGLLKVVMKQENEVLLTDLTEQSAGSSAQDLLVSEREEHRDDPSPHS